MLRRDACAIKVPISIAELGRHQTDFGIEAQHVKVGMCLFVIEPVLEPSYVCCWYQTSDFQVFRVPRS